MLQLCREGKLTDEAPGLTSCFWDTRSGKPGHGGLCEFFSSFSSVGSMVALMDITERKDTQADLKYVIQITDMKDTYRGQKRDIVQPDD